MKVIIDDKIPFIKGALEPFAEVLYFPGMKITAEVVKDADCIITRTRTICNANLLKGSKVKFIATATIGFDHIDTAYCRQENIHWANAPGCNAESVNQYIASALFSFAKQSGISLRNRTIGVVGVGHVGSKVAAFCQTIGMNVLKNDPPRERQEGSGEFVNIEKIKKEADIISFHVPLNRDGKDRTYHMVDTEFLEGLEKIPLLINTCRGEVFESNAVYHAQKGNDISGLILDCWEGEPNLNVELLKLVDYGTPHIAGYSRDGKANGTKICVQHVCRFFDLGINHWEPKGLEQPDKSVIEIDGHQKSEHTIIAEAVLSTYNIANDDKALKESPHLFETLRGDYPARREFGFYQINTQNTPKMIEDKMEILGFKINSNTQNKN